MINIDEIKVEDEFSSGKDYSRVSTIRDMMDLMWPTDRIYVKDANSNNYYSIVNCVADESNGYLYLYIEK